MQQDFLPWGAFASAAPAACDPYLPEPDIPLGGEKNQGEKMLSSVVTELRE